jgi:hypothetical protein
MKHDIDVTFAGIQFEAEGEILDSCWQNTPGDSWVEVNFDRWEVVDEEDVWAYMAANVEDLDAIRHFIDLHKVVIEEIAWNKLEERYG